MTTSDAPQVGQVIDHHCLWTQEQAAGLLKGSKPRPCLIVAVERDQSGASPRVTVLPITTQPTRSGATLAIPDDIKTRAKLDRMRPAGLVLEEANIFTWQSADLVAQPGGGFVRGVVTREFFTQVRDALLALHAHGRPKAVEQKP